MDKNYPTKLAKVYLDEVSFLMTLGKQTVELASVYGPLAKAIL
jgi:hypothetical protein